MALRRLLVWLGAAAALSLVAAACGGGETVEGADVVPPASTAPVAGSSSEPTGSTASASVTSSTDILIETASAGCTGGAAPVAGWSNSTMSSGGIDRLYWYYLPASYAGSTPVPLVLDLHAYQSPARAEGAVSHLWEKAEEFGFVTVAPEGNYEVTSEYRYWNVLENPSHLDDVGFIDALIDELGRVFCLDLTRVYLVGFDMGAQMTSVIACQLSDRIAAAAVIAGSYITTECERERPVPVIFFHGTEDSVQLYEGGLGTDAGQFVYDDVTREAVNSIDRPPVEDTVAWWAETNGCTSEFQDERVSTNIIERTFDCPENASVQLFKLEGAGHLYPPGTEELLLNLDLGPYIAEYGSPDGSTPASFFANDEIWELFSVIQLT